MQVGLQSGEALMLRRVTLYPRRHIQVIANLKSEAAVCLAKAGSSSVFAMGSPGLVVAELAAFSIINAFGASSAEKKAGELYREAAETHAAAIVKSHEFDIADISGIGSPKPADWAGIFGEEKRNVMFGDYEKTVLDKIFQANNFKPGRFQASAELNLPVHFCHDGEVFIRASDAEGEVRFRWDNVCSYRLIEAS